MRLNRFNTMNEAAKKADKKELEEKSLKFIMDELKKNKLSRYDMIKKIEDKFEGETDIDKIARKTADDITHAPLSKKEKSVAYFWIGEDAKDPKDMIKPEKKEKEDKKEDKVKRFKDFKKDKKDEDIKSSGKKEERGAGLKRWREEQARKKAEAEKKK
jgi:hypothetical protein